VNSRKLLITLIAALACMAALPSLASALTITVDDDRAQCPLADEITLTAAVAAAANGDTVKVCAGTYTVPGGPAPSSGLKIEKNISIAGAGADKVFVEPVQGSGSMAQVAPNPRDEYGNVITVRRRLIELYDVSISGLTVRAGDVPVEAGITMTDVVTGTISGVKVEGIVPVTGPGTGAFEPPAALADHGQGIVVANTIEKTSNVTTITGSSVSGFNSTGILVDNRLLSGSGQVTGESVVTAKITNTKVTGAGASSPIGQTGVEAWGSGARIQITKSKISGVGKADGSAAAVELHGVDLANSVVGGSEANANDLTENLYGATNVAYDGSAALTALNATGNFWGTTVTADPTPVPLVGANVTTAPVAELAPAAPTIAPAVDNLPTAQWDTSPANGSGVPVGVAIPLAVVAGDDFGVKQVEFKANTTSLGIAATPTLLGERVYKGSWTPSEAQAGTTVTISAVVTDSGGQTSQIQLNIGVEGKPKFTASPTITGLTSGYATIGKALTCNPGSASGYPAPTYSYSWTVNGVAAGTATNTYTPVSGDSGKKVVCSVTATNKLGSASAGSGQALVASVPKLASPAVLSGYTGSYALVGDELTCAAGAASGDPLPSVTYAWKQGEVTLPVTTATYTVLSGDVGSSLSCTVTATSAGGTATSTASVTAGAPPSFAGTPGEISGTSSGYAVVGKALTCASGEPAGFPVPTVTYTWKAGATTVGTNAATYTPVSGDAGKAITCTVKIANALNSAEATGSSVPVQVAPKITTAAKITGYTGTYALVGQELTCSAVASGDPAPALSYAWKRGEVTLPVTTATYTVVGFDVGSSLSCTVTAASAAGSATSSASVTAGAAPTFAGTAGSIGGATSGYVTVGKTLTCTTGNPTGFPVPTVTYVWKAGETSVGTSATYSPTVSEIGKEVTCTVKIANTLGSTETTGAAVKVADPPAFTAAAEISGASGVLAEVGDPLVCAATAAGDPAPGVSYQWLRDGAAIAGADASTYTVETADEGHELTCKATASSLAGSVSSSDTVGVGGPPGGGVPVLSGLAKVGSVLTCAPGTWAGIPKPQLSYQWLLNGAPIAGATGSSYTTTLADVGGKVTCEVTATTELGSVKATSTELTVAAASAAAVPPVGAGKVSGKVASLATVTCDVGPCTVSGPTEAKVKIGKVTYKVKLIYPGTLDSGATGVVTVKLTKAAKKALAKAGKSRKLTVTLTITGGGSSTSQAFSLSLKAPKK